MFDFSGKTALITGAGSGIGKATAEYFLSCGAQVAVADIHIAALEAVARELDPSGARVASCKYDASDSGSAAELVGSAVARFGSLDYLVAGAGIYAQQNVPEMSDDQWHRMISVNLDGIFYITRRAIPHMNEGGAFVTVASVAAHQGGTYGNAHYGASKGGILAYTKGLAREVAPRLRANTVSPGWVETPMVSASLQRGGPELLKGIPLQRVGKPREIASVIAFLCSDAASFITGEAIIAAGGAYMG